MPEKIDKCVEQLMKQGKDKDEAYAICTYSINKENKEMKRKKGKKC